MSRLARTRAMLIITAICMAVAWYGLDHYPSTPYPHVAMWVFAAGAAFCFIAGLTPHLSIRRVQIAVGAVIVAHIGRLIEAIASHIQDLSYAFPGRLPLVVGTTTITICFAVWILFSVGDEQEQRQPLEERVRE